MDPVELAERLCAAAPRRAAGSDAERRAARLLALELRRAGRADARIRTLWVRPAGAAVHALLTALAVAGSVVAVDAPATGLAMVGAAIVLLAGDLSGRLPVLRRLTYERATQLVVARDPREAAVRVVLAAPLDVPRTGVLDAGALARRLPRSRVGRYGVLLAGLLGLTACAALRVAGVDGDWLGPVQLVPTVLALVLLAALIDTAASRPPRRGTGGAAAAAVAVALAVELARTPPRALAVDVVLHGAGPLGFRRWVRDERRPAEEVAVVAIEACAAGEVRAWSGEGLVLPLPAHPQLRAHAHAAGVPGVRTASTSAARVAGARRWPALRLGTVGPGPADDPEIDPAAVTATLAAARAVIAALDAELAPLPRAGSRHARRAARTPGPG